MAQIVCIGSGTLRTGINEIGDIVDIVDDKTDLTGSGYISFDIIRVKGISANDVRIKLNSQTEPDVRKSKYSHQSVLSQQDKDNLNSDTSSEEQKMTILKKIEVKL